ncbi:putative secreted protein [Nocardia nova SH22a]|uniref:Putative secreted protein n=1 Tax=Nocardia nova SH22a TaxID=1415166 RepID=W5TW97_9NOCA|nr:GAF domain-containing protein [Nocardia nova]AHH21441.1 putative secreted protein [Nocardia nova SH22a]
MVDSAAPAWLLVETLAPGLEPTVVADGYRVRDWTTAARAGRSLGAATALATAAVEAAAVAVPAKVGGAVDDSDSIVLSEGGWTAIAVPIFCSFGAVHGVQLWVGASGQLPPARRAVAAWDWDSDTELAHHGPGLEELAFARAPEDVRVVRTPPEVFGRMVRFDDRMGYTAVIAGTDPAGRWQGEVAIRGDDEIVRTFQLVVRVHRDDPHLGPADPPRTAHITRALLHEITDVRPPRPDTDLAITRAVSRSGGGGVGFVELAMGVVYEWTSPPPPPLDRWATERPVVHPDDQRIFRAACAAVFDDDDVDATREFVFRIRFEDSDWIPVRAELSRLGSERAHGMIRVRPASG